MCIEASMRKTLMEGQMRAKKALFKQQCVFVTVHFPLEVVLDADHSGT